MAEVPVAGPSSYWRIDEWFPDLPELTRAGFKIFNDELSRSNRFTNLVSPKTLQMADVIHFADSICGGRLILAEISEGSTIFDLGGGNGFPGVVIAAIAPKYNFVIVDSDGKKCEFLRGVVTLLNLKNVEIRNVAIDSLPLNCVEFGIERGLGNVSKSMLMARKCFKTGGSFYHFKGEQWSMEVGEIPTQLCSVWTPALVGEYKLPIGPVKFAIVKTTKIQK
ncbi:MAG: class I SAM-dependent methyltransferase [Bdellovibrionaceae bacterium]|nr:class I SAM-dependent methyltransferase [Pseudobdellovibrionaceae bacterium]